MHTSDPQLWPEDEVAYVQACFGRVLGRRPDPDEQAAALALLRAVGRDAYLVALLESDTHREQIADPPFVPPGHFYSPIPSNADIEAVAAGDWNPASLPGIDLHEQAQLDLLARMASGYSELPFGEQPRGGARYHYANPNYGYSDAIFLALMVRELQPRRYIEVGSGDSSCALLDAIDAFCATPPEVTFVEPHPEYLQQLLGPEEARRIRLLPDRLQDVPLTEFECLAAGDVLFIDSTHVAKAGSDVNFLVFEILPRLAPGVVVHVHDVFYPFEYPIEWLRAGRAWNEQYVLRAFLEFNDAFEILLFGPFMVARHRAWFEQHMPLCNRNPGGALWLRRSA